MDELCQCDTDMCICRQRRTHSRGARALGRSGASPRRASVARGRRRAPRARASAPARAASRPPSRGTDTLQPTTLLYSHIPHQSFIACNVNLPLVQWANAVTFLWFYCQCVFCPTALLHTNCVIVCILAQLLGLNFLVKVNWPK